MLLSVPYYSQYLDVGDKNWRPRACGVVCLKMLLGAQFVKTPSIDEMIRQGESIGAYGPSGWTHEGLIALARKYYTKLSRAEWRQASWSRQTDVRDMIPQNQKPTEELNEEGIEFLISELRTGHPLIVSAIKNFDETNKFHMVVLTGFEEVDGKVVGFYYHDSDTHHRGEGKNQFVSIYIFRTGWRRMCIFEA